MVNFKRIGIKSLIVLMLLIFIGKPILISAQGLSVFDEGNLFNESQIEDLEREAKTIGDNYNMDIIILTSNDTGGKSSRDYADDYFDYNGFGRGTDRDGILFLIDMDNREAYISTSGIAIRYLTDQRIEGILDIVFDSGMGDGDYYSASKGFLSGTEQYLAMGIPQDQYSEEEGIKEKNSLSPMEAAISAIAGLGLSGGFFLRTKSKYKMKNPSKPLTFRNNSIVNLTREQDQLIDTIVTHRIIPKPSSNSGSSGKSTTHTSSSGRSHGGGGRKF